VQARRATTDPSTRRRRFSALLRLIIVVVIVGCGVGVYALTRPSGHAGLRHCVYTEGGPAGVRAFQRITDDPDIRCAETFNESAATWEQWSHPFSAAHPQPGLGWPAWVRADRRRRLIVSQSLIPASVEHEDWLAAGSRGAYTRYAAALARDLISNGLAHAIIRLAPEANGTWETYSLPTTAAGLAQWREFWRRTVLAMRAVPGAHFTFDWNINALVRPVPLRSFYPGDDVVDVVGIDAYDPVSFRGGWNTLANGPDGIRAVARFARAHGKPLSVPEWGIVPNSPGVGAAYIRGLARVLRHTPAAYECYFYAHQFEAALSANGTLKALFEQNFAHR
jgi:hypothetical protein